MDSGIRWALSKGNERATLYSKPSLYTTKAGLLEYCVKEDILSEDQFNRYTFPIAVEKGGSITGDLKPMIMTIDEGTSTVL